jgi:peptidyl-prolyl cis-trans isomerase B (cyclophilin B)
MFNQTGEAVSGEYLATIKTSQGDMVFRLFASKVPEGVKNFVTLAQEGKYKDVPFHRVIKDFMIQGGDFTNKNGTGGHSYNGPGTNIGDEYDADLTHIRGALSYAKTSLPNSIGSQFFVVHPENGTHFLNHPANGGPADGYTVFGQLLEGFDVLDAIATSKTDRSDCPLEPQVILDIEVSQVQ